MSERFYWENGERVPVVDPRYDEPEKNEIDSPPLVMMRTVMGILQQCRDPALTIECLTLISSIGYQGSSMTEIARRNMVSRATVSRRCVDYCKQLGIPTTRAMRNESGQSNCRKAQIARQVNLIQKYTNDNNSNHQ